MAILKAIRWLRVSYLARSTEGRALWAGRQALQSPEDHREAVEAVHDDAGPPGELIR